MSQPPLKAIQCFCLAARHLSFKQAATELSVTAAAVSQQVKLLEHWLGFALFRRRARSIALTEAGNAYYHRVVPLMEELVGVSQTIQRVDRARVVGLAVPPGFAALVLGSALPAFRDRFPDIELHLHASSLLHELQASGSDLALRYLTRPDDTLDCTRLVMLDVFPVCSPRYLETFPALAAGRLDGTTLLHDSLHADWQRLMHAHGLPARSVSHLHCDLAMLALQSAEQGLGVALADNLLGRDALASGRLVVPFSASLPARRHLYLVHRRAPEPTPDAERVKQWLIARWRERDDASPTPSPGLP
ncbi:MULTISPECIES: LysR substrate-binding domain-containing protein [unclassified Modicisalibacter]|uniref:LysR substrate-binding domain-containing protein n=1 Tax=unclassified Modicisalibacter TaxID=2679913 RepID=UPI001CCE120B|nr:MULTISPECIES: LysR substrate-binding domain-containing protein [unclassified Modicisalibacter]MBZ9558928.1 LysR family transcriptional regulator [Modicisalibacter sp. R2A 31.J]MBZ9575180.1 LysR family transcriptional regulator [Modicisalibacter sp. MOD 31.J]